MRIERIAAGKDAACGISYQGSINRYLAEGDHIHKRGRIDQNKIVTLPQYGHVAMKPQIVLRGQPCAVTIFGNAHRRGERGGMAGLFKRGAEWPEVVDINHFLHISPRESDPSHLP